MATEKKAKIVESLQETFSRCRAGILTDYRGHTTAELNELRRKLREAGIEYRVVKNSLAQLAVEVTHVNLNDRTLEGFRHRKLPVFAVQYHPEAGPGPHDARHLFDRFVQLMQKGSW